VERHHNREFFSRLMAQTVGTCGKQKVPRTACCSITRGQVALCIAGSGQLRQFCLAAALLALPKSHLDGLSPQTSLKRGMLMSSTLSPAQSEFSAARWATEPSVDDASPLDLKDGRRSNKPPSLSKRASRALTGSWLRFASVFAATLAWQAHGDAARGIFANSSETLVWLAPPPDLQIVSGAVAPAAPVAPSADVEQLKTTSLGLALMRQSVDQLVAGQEQMARDIAKLQAVEQDILRKISEPPPRAAVAPAQKAAAPSQTPRVR
jgi:hypothetical protein